MQRPLILSFLTHDRRQPIAWAQCCMAVAGVTVSLTGWSAQDQPATIAHAPQIALSQDYSLTDIAELRAQARGQGGVAYIAYPQLILNGSPTAHMLPVQIYGEELAVDVQALAEQGVELPQSTTTQWQTLKALGIAGRYDRNNQKIQLVVPAEWLPNQSLSAGMEASGAPLQRGNGALLNYDAYSTWLDNGKKSTSASHEARVFGEFGAFSSSGVVRWVDDSPDDGRYIRLDSYWRYTDADNMRTYMAGDTLSGALSWTPSVRLAGVQLSRNFASRPDLITFPLPQISGSATLPSALEVFVNDLRLTDQTVQPGPFVLETSPRVTGLGQVQVVTTDTLGRQVAQTVPFYVSPKLLRTGFWDYSATLGTPRRFYAQRSNDYDNEPVASGVARYGLNDQLTLETTASASASLLNTGIGTVIRPGFWGVSNLAVAHGQDDEEQGFQWVAGHEFRSTRYAVSGQYTHRTEGYRDLSNTLDVRPNIKSSLQLNSSMYLGEQGSLNASYLDTQLFNGNDSRFLVIGHTRTLWGQLSMNFSVNQNLDDSHDRTWLAGFNYRFNRPNNRPIQAGARIDHNEANNDTRTILTLRQQVEEFWDLGWDLAYSPDPNGIRQANGRFWTPYGDIQAGVYGDANETNSYASVAGSVVSNFDDVFAANTMNNSFAIVDTGGFADIPVRRSNRIIGHTNQRGRLLLPDLIPYTENQLDIDVDDLPADARIDNTHLTIKPTELTGVTARFEIEQQHSAILVIQNENGQPVTPGSRVLFGDADATVVGFDGEVFIQGLKIGANEIGIIGQGRLCTVQFAFQAKPGTLQRLGPYTCVLPENRP